MGYLINYRPKPYPPFTANTINITNANINSRYVMNLIIYTEYQVKVAAYNIHGVGAYSNETTVRTAEGRPTAPPTDVTGQPVSGTEIRLTWWPPNPQKINGRNMGYKIDLIGPDGSTRRVVVPANSTGDQLEMQEATVTGLLQAYSYEITVLCFTGAGEGPKSSAITLKTLEGIIFILLTIFHMFDMILWKLPTLNKYTKF